jgi:hypothetical protein
MIKSPQTKTNGSASPDVATSTITPSDITIPFDQEEVKRNLDRAWEKFQHALHQEAEGNDQWIESTLELSKILYDARQRLPPDQAFGEWLTKSGYGEERITRNDHQALQNMALNLAVTREVLAQTHRRSWRLIWEQEIQPRLHSPVQPPAGEKPNAATQRPKKGAKKGAKKDKQKSEEQRNMRGWLKDQVVAVNAVINEINIVMAGLDPEQHSQLKELEFDLPEEAFQNGLTKSSKLKHYASLPWKQAAKWLTSRVKRTFAPIASEQHPEG